MVDAVAYSFPRTVKYQKARAKAPGNPLSALQAFFRSGSASEAAAELYCHRNTVLNRLARFNQLTGFDPAYPQDAAMIAALHIDALP